MRDIEKDKKTKSSLNIRKKKKKHTKLLHIAQDRKKKRIYLVQSGTKD